MAYHACSAHEHGVTADEAVEAVELGVVTAGSLSYPTACNAVELIDRLLR